MTQRHTRQIILGLLLFGISFGYVEAAIVVYLRAMYEPLRQSLAPNRKPGELFPLMTAEQIASAQLHEPQTPGSSAPGTSTRFLVQVEVAREAATILMLAGTALVATGNRHLWLPAFSVVFGTWDLFFYVFLRVLVNWPASLLTWDILFLIPVPWVAPVLAPVLVAISIITAGIIALLRPVQLTRLHWLAATLGGALILWAFMWDFRNIVGGGLPNPFQWPLFLLGEALGMGAFFHAMQATQSPSDQLRDAQHE